MTFEDILNLWKQGYIKIKELYPALPQEMQSNIAMSCVKEFCKYDRTMLIHQFKVQEVLEAKDMKDKNGEKKSDELATVKQIELMDKLKIPFTKTTTKKEASVLIKNKLDGK